MNDLKENTNQFLVTAGEESKFRRGDKHNCGFANYLSHLQLLDKEGSSELQ